MPSAGYDRPHSHMGFDGLSTTKNFSCPSVITNIFKAFVLMAFGSVRSRLESSIDSVAQSGFGKLALGLLWDRTSEGLEFSSQEVPTLIDYFYPTCSRTVSSPFLPGEDGDLCPTDYSQQVCIHPILSSLNFSFCLGYLRIFDPQRIVTLYRLVVGAQCVVYRSSARVFSG